MSEQVSSNNVYKGNGMRMRRRDDDIVNVFTIGDVVRERMEFQLWIVKERGGGGY